MEANWGLIHMVVLFGLEQFRLFFVWLTKSLRQLNGDVIPQSNQLPVIDRWVCLHTYASSLLVLWNTPIEWWKSCSLLVRRYSWIITMLVWWTCWQFQLRGSSFLTLLFWEGPNWPASGASFRGLCCGCRSVSLSLPVACKYWSGQPKWFLLTCLIPD